MYNTSDRKTTKGLRNTYSHMLSNRLTFINDMPSTLSELTGAKAAHRPLELHFGGGAAMRNQIPENWGRSIRPPWPYQKGGVLS